jgi:MFS family permease
MSSASPASDPAVTSKAASHSFLYRFLVLKGAARELWVTFAIKLFGILAYGVMNSTLVLWLSYDLGYSDTSAGALVFGWSATMTLATVLVGSLTDAIGLRKSFLIGVYVCVGARLVMTFATIKWLALAGGLLPLAIGEALGTPVLVAAIHRYSNTAQRSIAFSIFYALMNVGFLVGSLVFDFVRERLGEPHGHLALPLIGVELTTYRVLFLASFIFELMLLPIVHFGIREGVEATDQGLKITPGKPKCFGQKMGSALFLSARNAAKDSVRIFSGLWGQPGFYKFLAFLALAAFVRLIFIQMYYTYPKFGIRELGPGAPIGRLWAINSILIIVIVPIVGALTQRIAAYRMVTIGSAVAAASVYVMALPPAWFEPLAQSFLGQWVGHFYLGLDGTINPYYVIIFLYVVLLSVGESIYSPRLYEYAAAIAPKGQEASYMAVSYLPFFLAKLLVSFSSGMLLARFCPETGPRNSGTLWLIIAMTTTVAPVGLIALRRFIRVHETGRE